MVMGSSVSAGVLLLRRTQEAQGDWGISCAKRIACASPVSLCWGQRGAQKCFEVKDGTLGCGKRPGLRGAGIPDMWFRVPEGHQWAPAEHHRGLRPLYEGAIAQLRRNAAAGVSL